MQCNNLTPAIRKSTRPSGDILMLQAAGLAYLRENHPGGDTFRELRGMQPKARKAMLVFLGHLKAQGLHIDQIEHLRFEDKGGRTALVWEVKAAAPMGAV